MKTMTKIEPWMRNKDGTVDRRYKLPKIKKKKHVIEGQRACTTTDVLHQASKEHTDYWVKIPRTVVDDLGIRVRYADFEMKVTVEKV